MMAACAKPMPTSSPILMMRPALAHGQCLYSVEGRWLNDGELLATARKHDVETTIDADAKAPGPCFVMATRILEMAGTKRIGFISEPPPPR